MANLCIIPSRGGSKRIPKKNIKNFLGRPIIAYSIEAAFKSNLFNEIMVSTDDDVIAEIAAEHGANIPFKRSPKASDDFATTADVIYEVLTAYEKRGLYFENVCCIYPCAPLISLDKLEQAYQMLIDKKLDSVFPIVSFSYPIQRALHFNEEKLFFMQPEFATRRSQDLETTYHDAGQFYWLNTMAFKKKKKILTDNSSAIILLEQEAQDIDNETDWQLAELKYQLVVNTSKRNK